MWKKGDEWFVGVLNNSQGKSIEINLDFLPEGKYEAEIWTDSKRSDSQPMELLKKTQTLKSGGEFKVKLAKNGGFVAILKAKD